MLKAFDQPDQPVSMFHMGGDEVNFDCWATDKNITDWMSTRGFSPNPAMGKEGYLELWSLFQNKALDKLMSAGAPQSVGKNVILWTSELAKPEVIEK